MLLLQRIIAYGLTCQRTVEMVVAMVVEVVIPVHAWHQGILSLRHDRYTSLMPQIQSEVAEVVGLLIVLHGLWG